MRRLEVWCDSCGSAITPVSSDHYTRVGVDFVEDACSKQCVAALPSRPQRWARWPRPAPSPVAESGKSTGSGSTDNLVAMSRLDPAAHILSEQELAKRLKMSVRGLQHLRQQGKGPPHVKLCKLVRYDWMDVEKWISSKKQQTTKTPRFERAAAEADRG